MLTQNSWGFHTIQIVQFVIPCLLLTLRMWLSIARMSDGLSCVCAKGKDYSNNAWGYFLLVKIRDETISTAGLSQQNLGCILTIHEVC